MYTVQVVCVECMLYQCMKQTDSFCSKWKWTVDSRQDSYSSLYVHVMRPWRVGEVERLCVRTAVPVTHNAIVQTHLGGAMRVGRTVLFVCLHSVWFGCICSNFLPFVKYICNASHTTSAHLFLCMYSEICLRQPPVGQF